MTALHLTKLSPLLRTEEDNDNRVFALIDLVNRPFILIALLRTLYFYDTITPVNHFWLKPLPQLSIPTSWVRRFICPATPIKPTAKIFGKLLASKNWLRLIVS